MNPLRRLWLLSCQSASLSSEVVDQALAEMSPFASCLSGLRLFLNWQPLGFRGCQVKHSANSFGSNDLMRSNSQRTLCLSACTEVQPHTHQLMTRNRERERERDRDRDIDRDRDKDRAREKICSVLLYVLSPCHAVLLAVLPFRTRSPGRGRSSIVQARSPQQGLDTLRRS